MQSDLAKTARAIVLESRVGNRWQLTLDFRDDKDAMRRFSDAYRTGKLIALPDDAAWRMARAISVCADKLNEDAPDTCGRLSFVLNRSDQFATAALAALTKGTDHAG